MTRPLKNLDGFISTRREWEVRHRDGRRAMQVQAAVRVPSMAAAARALDTNVPFVKDYMGETGNAECLAALDRVEPGTVIICPMDPGGSVMGQEGWIVADPQPGVYPT